MCGQVRSYPISSSVEKKKTTKKIMNLLLGHGHKMGPMPHTPALPEEVNLEVRGLGSGVWLLSASSQLGQLWALWLVMRTHFAEPLPLHLEIVSACMHVKSLQACPTLCDPVDYSLLGCSVHGILQQEYWSGLPRPPPGDLLHPGIKPESLISPTLAGRFSTTSTIWEAQKLWVGWWYYFQSCSED